MGDQHARNLFAVEPIPVIADNAMYSIFTYGFLQPCMLGKNVPSYNRNLPEQPEHNTPFAIGYPIAWKVKKTGIRKFFSQQGFLYAGCGNQDFASHGLQPSNDGYAACGMPKPPIERRQQDSFVKFFGSGQFIMDTLVIKCEIFFNFVAETILCK